VLDDLRESWREALADFNVPLHARFLAREELPITASSTVQKHRLRGA